MEYSNLPDLSSLGTLKAIVEGGGVSAAARIMHIGQPAVTKRLRALEESYGVSLMQRISGRLRLTEAGQKVYHTATLILERHLALREELRSLTKGHEVLRLEVTAAIGEHLLPDLLIDFNETHPRYRIESRLAYSRQIVKHLSANRVDMALLETAPEHPDILVQKWQDDKLWLVCGMNHPLANVSQISPNDMLNQKFVLREPRSSIRTALDKSLQDIGIEKLNIAFEVGSSEAIVDVLDRGKHLSYMPRFAVEERVREGSLHHITVSDFRILRTLWIARSRSGLTHSVAEAFISLIQSLPVVSRKMS
ncbi:hypothetical protein MNBD_GAMMA12-3631 [hydrothermal vent metagenome]|uniref:HTH lysR-type domain-containing protein n=1 Tax=hydrothermal vent metagenome TaxID=652676 RepID=A0A3B0YP98_9ZZZZ